MVAPGIAVVSCQLPVVKTAWSWRIEVLIRSMSR
jgi:hypothetical protein